MLEQQFDKSLWAADRRDMGSPRCGRLLQGEDGHTAKVCNVFRISRDLLHTARVDIKDADIGRWRVAGDHGENVKVSHVVPCELVDVLAGEEGTAEFRRWVGAVEAQDLESVVGAKCDIFVVWRNAER